MASLVKYGMLSYTTNSMAGSLVKAQCDLCGRKFGSIEEARKCEVGHFNNIVNGLSKFCAKMYGGADDENA